jgi:hypothetical protein
MPTMPALFVPVTAPGGYSHGGPGGVVRTEVAGGAARYALDWDCGVQRFNVTLLLDPAQYSVWVAFYHYSIQKGAIAFDMPLDSGFGLQQHEVNIVPGSCQAVHDNGFITVSFVVEAESAAYAMSDAEVATFATANGLTAESMPDGFEPVTAPGGYSHDGPGGVMSDAVAGGNACYALEWDRGVQQFNVTLMLTDAEYEIWSVWFHRMIKKGARAFEMMLDSGFGLDAHLVNIIPGSYSATHNDTFIVISFVAEGESAAYALGEAAALALIAVYGEYGMGTNALFDRISRFANVDTLVLDL